MPKLFFSIIMTHLDVWLLLSNPQWQISASSPSLRCCSNPATSSSEAAATKTDQSVSHSGDEDRRTDQCPAAAEAASSAWSSGPGPDVSTPNARWLGSSGKSHFWRDDSLLSSLKSASPNQKQLWKTDFYETEPQFLCCVLSECKNVYLKMCVLRICLKSSTWTVRIESLSSKFYYSEPHPSRMQVTDERPHDVVMLNICALAACPSCWDYPHGRIIIIFLSLNTLLWGGGGNPTRTTVGTRRCRRFGRWCSD